MDELWFWEKDYLLDSYSLEKYLTWVNDVLKTICLQMNSSEISSHHEEEISSIFSLKFTKDAHPCPRLTIIIFPFEDHPLRSDDLKCVRVVCRLLEIFLFQEFLHSDIDILSRCNSKSRHRIVRLPIDNHITETLLGCTEDESFIEHEWKLIIRKHTPNLSWNSQIARVSEIKWKILYLKK